jgi:DNA-binding PadR family transcriptional regulator
VTVREALLGLLAGGPRYGYELKVRFEDATASVWPLNIGQVYTTLDRLERDGSVTVKVRDEGQKLYDLSPEGHQELDEWFADSAADGPPPRDELLLKVLTSLATSPNRTVEIIGTHRGGLVQRLAELRRIPPSNDLAAHVVRDARLARIEAELIWLDRCEERIAGTRIAERTNPNSATPSTKLPLSSNGADHA